MTREIDIIKKCPLFSGMDDASLDSLLACLVAETRSIEKGIPVFMEGDKARHVGLVLSGSIQILRDDIHGARNVIATVGAGELFAETFACAMLPFYPVSAIAVKDSSVLLMNIQKMLTVCTNACGFHNTLVANLLRIVAQKTIALNRKIDVMSKRTTREKLIAFLMDQAKQSGSDEFSIPFDRQALADYLCVERSGMSVELNRLKKEGLIDTQGSWFRLIGL